MEHGQVGFFRIIHPAAKRAKRVGLLFSSIANVVTIPEGFREETGVSENYPLPMNTRVTRKELPLKVRFLEVARESENEFADPEHGFFF